MGPGPRCVPFNLMLNIGKALIPIILFGMMCHYDNFTFATYLYLAMHGTYGVLWVVKDCIFPDVKFA